MRLSTARPASLNSQDEGIVSTPLTAIWRAPESLERAFISELFAGRIDKHIDDPRSEIALDNSLVLDAYLHTKAPDHFAPFCDKRAALFHLGDETYEGGYEHYRNFKHVFRNYYSVRLRASQVTTLPLGYAARLPERPEGTESASGRRYVWAFLGGASKASRPEMLHALKGLEPSFVCDTEVSAGLSEDQYMDVLSQSAFVPCPMGYVNLESFRIYEALETGAIPILEKRYLNYFERLFGPNPLPAFKGWPDAAGFVRELSAAKTDLDRLQSQCVLWWQQFKKQKSLRISEVVEGMSPGSSTWQVGYAARLRALSYGELLAHHTGRALTRRVAKLAKRVYNQGKLRATHGR